METAAHAVPDLVVEDEFYDGPEWWGTVKIKNNGDMTSTRFTVSLTLPAGAHCTAEPESVPSGATLSPLAGLSSPDRTVSNQCIFTFNGPTIAPGQIYTFHYSTDSQDFTHALTFVSDGTAYNQPVCNSFSVTTNTYNGAEWWGTIKFKNNGPAVSSNYKVEFDVPSGVHCTNDYVPPGAVLSPLNGTGSSARTVSNHCVFTWTNASPLAVGSSKQFNYSTDSQKFSKANNVKVSDPATCSPGMCLVAGHTCDFANAAACCNLNCGFLEFLGYPVCL